MNTTVKSVPSGNPNGYCRLCFSERNLVALFRYDDRPRQYLLKEISNFTGIQIEANENQPCSICWRCAVAVEDFQLFRDRCLTNDAIIRSKYSETTVKHGEAEWLISIPVSELPPDLSVDENEDKSLLEPLVKSQMCSRNDNEESISEKIEELDTEESQISKSISCHLCQHEFGSRQSLYVHFKEQHSEHGRPFKCDFCQATFKRKSHLDDHVSSHTGETRYTCKYCEAKFTRAKQLMRHRRSCHKEYPLKTEPPNIQSSLSEGQFKCKYCPKSFKHRPSLNFHVKTHYELLPFVCETCNARFAGDKGLLIHRGKHHPDTVNAFRTASPASWEPTKTLKCSFCPRYFEQQRYLSQHMKFMHPNEIDESKNPEDENTMTEADHIGKHADVHEDTDAVTIKFEVEDNDDMYGADNS